MKLALYRYAAIFRRRSDSEALIGRQMYYSFDGYDPRRRLMSVGDEGYFGRAFQAARLRAKAPLRRPRRPLRCSNCLKQAAPPGVWPEVPRHCGNCFCLETFFLSLSLALSFFFFFFLFFAGSYWRSSSLSSAQPAKVFARASFDGAQSAASAWRGGLRSRVPPLQRQMKTQPPRSASAARPT